MRSEQADLFDDEEFLNSRTLLHIVAVVLTSVTLVVGFYMVGALPNVGNEGAPSSTSLVAQLPPVPPGSDAPDAAAADSSPTTATETTARPPASTVADRMRPVLSVPGTLPAARPPEVAQVSASDVRADSADSCGTPTNYRPLNAVDSVRETAWMAPGDGSGSVLTIELAEPAVVSEVGLVPGYDKFDPCTGADRFRELRLVSVVRWTFDDGSSIEQRLNPTRALQTTALDRPVMTSRVTMTILSTVEPGSDLLDHTPVSEVVIS